MSSADEEHEAVPLTIRQSLSQVLHRLQALETALEELNHRVYSLSLNLNTLAKLGDELAQLRANQTYLSQRQDEGTTLVHEVKRQRQADLDQFSRTARQLSRQIDELEKSMEELRDKIRAQEQRLQTVEEPLRQLVEGMTHLEVQQEETKRQIQQQSSRISLVAEQAHVILARVEHLEAINQALQPKDDPIGERITSLETSLNHLALELEERGHQTELALKRLQEVASQLFVARQELEERQEELTARLERLRYMLERQRRRHMDILELEVKELRGDLDKAP